MRDERAARARALLVEGLWLEGASRERLLALARADVDWRLFLQHAGRSWCLSTLGWTFGHHGLLDALPADVAAALADGVEHDAAQNSLLLRDLKRVVEALDRAEVPALFTKGAALLVAHYPSVAARHTDDLDVHVAETHVDAAGEALRSAGYEELTQVARDGRRTRVGSPGRANFVASTATPVDLHWGGSVDVWAGAEWARVDGCPVRIEGRDDLFAHLCRHALRQHGDPRMLARHLADARVLLERASTCGGPAVEQRATRAMVSILRRGSPRARDAMARAVLPEGAYARAWGALVRWRVMIHATTSVRSVSELRRLVVPSERYLDSTFGHDPASLPVRHLRRYARLVRGLAGIR